MADIELVIKIPQKWFDDMVREEFTNIDELLAVIQHGTLIPECHGRLGDLSVLRNLMQDEIIRHDLNEYGCIGLVNLAPTIIPADKEEIDD